MLAWLSWQYVATAKRSAAWRSVYRAGILDLFHRLAVIRAVSARGPVEI